MASCSSLKCSDICKCITLYSPDGTIVIDNSYSNCTWELTANPDITATFNDTTRELCIFNSGVVKDCVIIPDSDDQYLVLNGTDLSIVKPNGTVVNTVSLAGLIPVETTFSLTSLSLVVTPGGVHGHAPHIELVPSSDVNNSLILGSDGRPYVPQSSGKDVVINAATCITFTKVVTSGLITFTPVIDYNCIAAQVCGLCCQPPALFINNITSTSFDLYVTNLLVGDTYDVSIDNGATYVLTAQTTSPITVSGLSSSTTYHIVVRHNCANGGTAVSNPQTILTAVFICPPPTNLNIQFRH